MNIYRLLAILNTMAFAGTIVVNYLATSLPINNKTTGELSDAYPNYFVPAGLTFSIWGIIYLFLLGFIIYQFAKTDFKNIKDHHFLSRISFFFIFNCLANMTWIFMWHYQLVFLSLIIMLCILISLIYIYTRLEIGVREVSAGEKWLVHIPFSLYLGWITVATIANVTTLLVDMDWGGFGLPEEIWAVIMIFIASSVGFKVHSDRKDNAFLLVLVWAFLGVFIKRSGVAGNTDVVAIAAIFGMVMLIGTIGFRLLKNKTVESNG